MHRFHREEDRFRFGVTRALLRVLLGEDQSFRPHAVDFGVNRFGRPRIGAIAAQTEPLCFSVSHSGDFAVIGVARQRPIGVDVEWMRPGATLADIASSICGEAELAEVDEVPVADRPRDLHRRWTIKEAYIKAIGLGLSFDPQKVRVARVPETSAGTSCRGGFELRTRGQWTLVMPDVAPGYCAAIVVLGSDPVEFIRIE
jgi:4'-phosphopantetheinyl transferase